MIWTEAQRAKRKQEYREYREHRIADLLMVLLLAIGATAAATIGYKAGQERGMREEHNRATNYTVELLDDNDGLRDNLAMCQETLDEWMTQYKEDCK